MQSEDPEISGLAGEICSKITSVPKVLGIMIPISLLFDGCGMCRVTVIFNVHQKYNKIAIYFWFK